MTYDDYWEGFLRSRHPDAEGHLRPTRGGTLAPKAPLNKSKARKSRYQLPSEQGVIFRTLRALAWPLGRGRWELNIRFLVLNMLPKGRTVEIDNLHVKTYEAYVPSPPLLTISHGGEILLLSDNTLWSDGRHFSIAPGDGIEFDLFVHLYIYYGAPYYGSAYVDQKPGRTTFGLILDHYVAEGGTVTRQAVPSDCVYLFQCKSTHGGFGFKAIGPRDLASMRLSAKNQKVAKAVAEVAEHYHEHSSFNRAPSP